MNLDPRSSTNRIALGVFCLLFSVYLLTFSGTYHSSDEMAILVTADSLARRGSHDIDLLRWMGQQQGGHGVDGHLYSNKGLGISLASLPLYWLALQSERIGNVQAGMLTNAIVTAATGALVYLFLKRLDYGRGASLLTALAYGLATMAWPYARYLWSEPLAGLCLLAAAYFLLRHRQDVDRTSPLLAGVCLGAAILARLNAAIVAPLLGLMLLANLFRRHRACLRGWIRPVLSFGMPVLAALAFIGWYNWLRYGGPLRTGYPETAGFTTPFLEGLYGLILSPGKGLLWYNPVLVAALLAWPAFFRRNRDQGLLVACIVLGNVAFYSPWRMWWAGHSWGPRFLLTVVPFAILPLASALETAKRRRILAAGLGILAAASVGVQLLGIVVDFNLYLNESYDLLGLYAPPTLFDPSYSPLLRQFEYLTGPNVDLAWARGGSLNWPPLLIGISLVLVSGAALLVAHRRRQRAWMGGVLLLLVLGTALSLPLYAPAGDVAEAARALAQMERSDEVAALTDPSLTERFQNAYDGHLAVWGIPAPDELRVGGNAVWSIGTGKPESAQARFHVSDVRLDLYLPPDSSFELDRLPSPLLLTGANPGASVKLVAVRLGDSRVRAGSELPLTLYWRALAPMETSYTVFVHVIDEQGTKIGQVDRLPCGSGCLTTTWRPGDLVALWYHVPIESGATPGRYEVIAGLYDLDTGERLPWLDDMGSALGDTLSLGTIDVRP